MFYFRYQEANLGFMLKSRKGKPVPAGHPQGRGDGWRTAELVWEDGARRQRNLRFRPQSLCFGPLVRLPKI